MTGNRSPRAGSNTRAAEKTEQTGRGWSKVREGEGMNQVQARNLAERREAALEHPFEQ